MPGDTSAETISAIIADEAAIGMVNNKTTAVRLLPTPAAELRDIDTRSDLEALRGGKG